MAMSLQYKGHGIFKDAIAARVSNSVIVDTDDTIWHQCQQCRHSMTPFDTGINFMIYICMGYRINTGTFPSHFGQKSVNLT